MNDARTRYGVLALFTAVALSGCSQQGQVSEKASNRPLEGVAVVAMRFGSAGMVVQGSTRCMHMSHVVSDSQGKFSIPRGDDVYVAYKQGYHMTDSHEARVTMEPHSANPVVRFDQILAPLQKIPYGCPQRAELDRVIETILRPAYAELRPLVTTQQQFERAADVLAMIDTITDGPLVAHSNSQRRRAEWQQKEGAQ